MHSHTVILATRCGVQVPREATSQERDRNVARKSHDHQVKKYLRLDPVVLRKGSLVDYQQAHYLKRQPNPSVTKRNHTTNAKNESIERSPQTAMHDQSSYQEHMQAHDRSATTKEYTYTMRK